MLSANIACDFSELWPRYRGGFQWTAVRSNTRGTMCDLACPAALGTRFSCHANILGLQKTMLLHGLRPMHSKTGIQRWQLRYYKFRSEYNIYILIFNESSVYHFLSPWSLDVITTCSIRAIGKLSLMEFSLVPRSLSATSPAGLWPMLPVSCFLGASAPGCHLEVSPLPPAVCPRPRFLGSSMQVPMPMQVPARPVMGCGGRVCERRCDSGQVKPTQKTGEAAKSQRVNFGGFGLVFSWMAVLGSGIIWEVRPLADNGPVNRARANRFRT